MLNLHRLSVLHELERRGTLAAVARALSYSPSAVSQQLAQLERDVGMPVVEPVGRGVKLTDAGRILVEHTRVAIAALEDAESRLAATTGRITGQLRVASFQSALLSLLPAVLDTLDGRHPDLRVDIAQREATEASSGLLAGSFDVVLGEEYPGGLASLDRGTHRVDLGVDEVFLGLPPSGSWSAATQLADLADAPWALDPDGSAPGRWIRRLCRDAGFEPDVRFDGVDLLAHVEMVRAGRAVAALPSLLGYERTGGVKRLALTGTPERQLYTLTRTGRSTHPAVVAFRRALAEVFATMSTRSTP